MRISARSILVIFPGDYTLKEAYDLVAKWSPDSIHYDTVNDKRYILAKKNVAMNTVVKKLVDRGVVFKVGKDLKEFHIPHLSYNTPPMDTSQNAPQDIPKNPSISPEFKEVLQEVVRDVCTNKISDINISSQLHSLKSIIQERDETIIKLNETVAQKDSIIDSLNENINNLMSQINALTDAVMRLSINNPPHVVQSDADQPVDQPVDHSDDQSVDHSDDQSEADQSPEDIYLSIYNIVKQAATDIEKNYPGYRLGVDRKYNTINGIKTITGATVYLRSGDSKSHRKSYSFDNDISFDQWLLDNY